LCFESFFSKCTELEPIVGAFSSLHLALHFKLYQIGTQCQKPCVDRDPVSQSSFATLLAGTGDSKESESQLKERKRHVKNLNNLFGDREGRGHGVVRKPEPDSKWGREVEGRTIPLENATIWVFNEWIDRNKLAERPIKNWEQQRKIWASEGADEELQFKSEAEMVVEMVTSLPIFVLKNLGTYYSANMLMYATETNAQPTNLYRWLRDHRLKGRTDREAGEAQWESKWRALCGYCRSSSGPAERSLPHGRSSPKFGLPDPCPLTCSPHAICLLAMRNERAHRRRLNWPIYLSEVTLTSISLCWQEMR
jgi:hypothetical protein